MPASRSALAAFTDWVTRLGEAWEAADAGAIGPLFTVGATFQPTPFAELLRGRRSIVAHYAALFESWRGVSFAAQVLGAGDTYGVAHWRVATGARAIDGVVVAALDERGRCTSLRQWWHEAAD
ncbi:MAG TPA: nuclear transport factor 2 family protein [Candidatus Limnocylindria bacterium]|nr:nuclear transport factor 2 family protein [Candidatus Limnocylindria bacterium]